MGGEVEDHEVEVHAKEKREGSCQEIYFMTKRKEKVHDRRYMRFIPRRKVQARERRYENATTAQPVVDVVAIQ